MAWPPTTIQAPPTYLHLLQALRPAVGPIQHGAVAQIRTLRQRNVGHHARYDDAALEAMLEKVEQRLLHHVGDLVALEARPDQHHRPHRGHHVVRRELLFGFEKVFPLLFCRRRGQRSFAVATASTAAAASATAAATCAGTGRLAAVSFVACTSDRSIEWTVCHCVCVCSIFVRVHVSVFHVSVCVCLCGCDRIN